MRNIITTALSDVAAPHVKYYTYSAFLFAKIWFKMKSNYVLSYVFTSNAISDCILWFEKIEMILHKQYLSTRDSCNKNVKLLCTFILMMV